MHDFNDPRAFPPINPASGLTMLDACFDIAGNPYGASGLEYLHSPDEDWSVTSAGSTDIFNSDW